MRVLQYRAPSRVAFASSAVFFCLSLTSCAHQPQALWLKPGAVPDEFAQERYSCLQQSQQPNSTAFISRYGGTANSNIITNGGLFDACMNSRGWILTPVTDVKAFNEAARPIGEEFRATCSREEFQILFRKRMACKALDASPEQLSDRSKISNEEKIALARWLDVIRGANEKFAAIYRQYDSKNGDAMASVIEAGAAESRKLALDFSNGGYPWGEYSKRRMELTKRLFEDQKIALSN